MATAHLKVSGMTCGHCQAKVSKALEGVPGVYAVSVDLPGGSADVDYDAGKADLGRLTAAVAGAGYTAEPAA